MPKDYKPAGPGRGRFDGHAPEEWRSSDPGSRTGSGSDRGWLARAGRVSVGQDVRGEPYDHRGGTPVLKPNYPGSANAVADPVPSPDPFSGGGGSKPPKPPTCSPGGAEPGRDGEDAGGGSGDPGEASAIPWDGSPIGGTADGLSGPGLDDGLGWVSAGGLDDVRAGVAERAERLARRQAIPVFTATSFQAYVQRATIKPGGDLEITLGVPAVDKWEAFRLSDAAGIMVQVDCTRVFRDEVDDDE